MPSPSLLTLKSQGHQQGHNTLVEVMANPKLLQAFEHFLRQTWSHEGLYFMEAMTQLKHEHDPRRVEAALLRIYRTFVAPGAPLELNITTQNLVKDRMGSVRWAIISREIAIGILRETEMEISDLLTTKLIEFNCSVAPLPIYTSIPQNRQKRVVIIGGGFTGFTVASILDPMPMFHVTLIDTKDSFEYTPGIVRKIVNPAQSTSLRVRHDTYIRNGRFIIGYAEDIASDAQSTVVNGERIMFDYLVICTGSTYSSQLKSTDISSLYRLSGLEEMHRDLFEARRVLVVGGGLVGCELASEIAQSKFPGTVPKKQVTLVESHEHLVSRSNRLQQERALHYLQELGVEVVCGERIVDFDLAEDNTFMGGNGRIYSGYDKVFMATGTRPSSSILASCRSNPSLEGCVDAWGNIRVRPTLQIEHCQYKHIFAGGDVTNVVEEKTGYAATISGVCIARNICRLVKGKEPLKQGTKGTRAAPAKPLHGMDHQGGIGKLQLSSLKKTFAFLNPAWAALKLFDERHFLKMVQSQVSGSSHVFGKLPRSLKLPSSMSNKGTLQRHQVISKHECNQGVHAISSESSSSDTTASIHTIPEHFTFGDESINLFGSAYTSADDEHSDIYPCSYSTFPSFVDRV